MKKAGEWLFSGPTRHYGLWGDGYLKRSEDGVSIGAVVGTMSKGVLSAGTPGQKGRAIGYVTDDGYIYAHHRVGEQGTLVGKVANKGKIYAVSRAGERGEQLGYVDGKGQVFFRANLDFDAPGLALYALASLVA